MIAVKYLKMNAFDESPFDRKEWKMKRDENKNKNKNKSWTGKNIFPTFSNPRLFVIFSKKSHKQTNNETRVSQNWIFFLAEQFYYYYFELCDGSTWPWSSGLHSWLVIEGSWVKDLRPFNRIWFSKICFCESAISNIIRPSAILF